MSLSLHPSSKPLRAWAARLVAPLALLVAAAVLAPTDAAAQITTTIAPLQTKNQGQDRVSYSETYLPAYVGYRVTFTGGTSRATLNNFTGTLGVSSGTSAASFIKAEAYFKDSGSLAKFVPYYGANCVLGAGNKVSCNPSSLLLGSGQTLVIDLYYNSPSRLVSSTLGDCKSNINCLTQAGSTKYTVGSISTTKAATSAKVALGVYALLNKAIDQTGAVVSATPKDRTRTFYTGTSSDKSATSTDLFTTTVDVPIAAGSTTVSIVESLIPKSDTTCVRFITYCYQSLVTVPPPLGTVSFAPEYLTITIRADASNIASGTTLLNVTLAYQPDGSTLWYPIAVCPGGLGSNTPLAPTGTAGSSLYLPCVNNRQTTFSGDFIWEFISYKNGRFKML